MFSQKRWTLLFLLVVMSIGSIIFVSLNNKNEDELDVNFIFLITFDTLRADHLSCYGYPRQVAPFVDFLANNGILFENAFSHCATTAPAIASLFTSNYLLNHNVTKNWYLLDNDKTTMAEVLKNQGFETYAFTSVELFNACNLFQGFTYVDEPVDARKKWQIKYRQSAKTIETVKNYFETHSSIPEKCFIWIHLFDTHRPYYPPKQYLEKVLRLDDKKQMLKYWVDVQRINPSAFTGILFDKREKSDFFKNTPDYYQGWDLNDIIFEQMNYYDAEILYMDTSLKRIFRYFQHRGLNEKSLWIITADHGEGLGNHSWHMHSKFIYQEEIKIPLIIYSPNLKTSKKVKHIVEHADILPTVLNILNLKGNFNMFAGMSLKNDILDCGERYGKKYAFAQREYFKPRPNTSQIPVFLNYEHGETYSIHSRDFHLIYRTRGKSELFDTRNDPGETMNLINEEVSLAKILKAEIFKHIRIYKKMSVPQQANQKDIEKIKSLGYIE